MARISDIVTSDCEFADCAIMMTSAPRVLLLDYPGALASAVLGLVDILTHAGLRPETVRPQDMTAADWANMPGASAILLPPAATAPDPVAHPDLPRWIADQAQQGALICSACVGVIWVAAAGLDAGRPVTTHWGAGHNLQRHWPDLQINTDRLVIEYDDLVTAGGLMAWVDLARIVIERLCGHAKMLETARHFVVDPCRRDQRRFQRFQPQFDHGDAKVAEAQHGLARDLAHPPALPLLAQRLGLSPRSLQRRFQRATGLTVTQYLQQLRVEHAKTLLADSALPVAEVAAQSGYQDLPAFHRVFGRISGQTPAAFRKSLRDMTKGGACGTAL